MNNKRSSVASVAGATVVLFLCGVGATFACGASEASGDAPTAISDDDFDGSNEGADLGSSGGDGDASLDPDIGQGGAGAVPQLPEEVEEEIAFLAPVLTGRYLWSANPESGRVALIDVVDLTTRVLTAGLAPTYLTSVGSAAAPKALVINSGSSDVTRFQVTKAGVPSDTVKIHPGANRWSTSASGKWAIAWSQADRGVVLDPTEGLQEISVISLAKTMVSTRLTVGYRPRQIVVSADEARLIAVSEEGIALIELGATPEQVEWIELGVGAAERDVSINAAGTHALVRRAGDSTVELIDLDHPNSPQVLQFSAPVTDLDLAASGRAVAVIRSKRQVATFLLEDVQVDPTSIETVEISDEIFGSAALTSDGKTAVVYTNAQENERVTVVDLRADTFLEVRTISTEAPVYSVVTTPGGEHAAVLAGAPGQVADAQGTPGKSFSLVALRASRFPRVVGTSAPVAQVALGDSLGIITSSSSANGVYEAFLIELPGLTVTREVLSTRPLAVGVLADSGLAYAAQLHPEGRVTFFNVEAGSAKTVTGFELAAEVVNK